MATKTVAWDSGGGYITLTYTGIGNAPISVSSDANESFDDRRQTVQIVTTEGSPERAVSLLVKQKGKTYPAGMVFNYDYTGTVQQVTLPPGRYKLQCWGAQGGNSSSYSGTGSKGGYSEGEITLTEVTTFYIFVGGKGASSGNGGWNGGGGSSGSSSYNSGDTYGRSYPACGGGATDIALVTSDMAYSSRRNNRSTASLLSRFIVAGGGAGGSARYTEVTTSYEESKEEVVRSGNMILKDYNASGNFYSNYFIFTGIVGSSYNIEIGGDYFSSTYYFDGSPNNNGVYTGGEVTKQGQFMIGVFASSPVPVTYKATRYYTTTETSTDSSSSSSSSSQQGGGTSGRGTSPGTQNGGGGEFGLGKNQSATNYRYASGAGGGGWYGGGSSYSDSSTSNINSSGGGSGFVNTAANAGYRPSGYTGLQLDSGSTRAGNVSFPSPNGGNETGHSGNGYARITVL